MVKVQLFSIIYSISADALQTKHPYLIHEQNNYIYSLDVNKENFLL